MKKMTFCALFISLFVSSSFAQQMPAKIKKFLDDYYSSKEFGNWKPAPGSCGTGKSVLTADFDGDGKTDYLVRFSQGNTPKTSRFHLIAFFNQDGEFTPNPFHEEAWDERTKSSNTAVIPKGTTVSLGLGEEGEGPTIVLQTDGVMQQVCETDDAATYFYRDNEMLSIDKASMDNVKPTIMASSDKSLALPVVIDDYLTSAFPGWQMAPESELCGEKLLFMSGDFDGDNVKDYVINFVSGQNGKKRKMSLFAFLGRGENYAPVLIAEHDEEEDFAMMSFEVIPKGTDIMPGYGEEGDNLKPVTFETDTVRFFKCETDASAAYVFQNGRFKNIIE